MPVYSVIVSQLVQHTETTQIFVYAANPDEIIEAISRREPHLNDMNLIWKGSNYGDKLGCGCCKDDICLDNTIRDINLAVAKSAGGSPQLAQIIPPISSVRIAEIEAYVERSHKEAIPFNDTNPINVMESCEHEFNFYGVKTQSTVNTDPTGVPSPVSQPVLEFPVDDLRALLDYLENEELQMFHPDEIIGGETIVLNIDKLKAWLAAQSSNLQEHT